MARNDNVAIKRNKEEKVRDKDKKDDIAPGIRGIVDSAALWTSLRLPHRAWTTLRVVHTLHNTATILKKQGKGGRFFCLLMGKNNCRQWGKIVDVHHLRKHSKGYIIAILVILGILFFLGYTITEQREVKKLIENRRE